MSYRTSTPPYSIIIFFPKKMTRKNLTQIFELFLYFNLRPYNPNVIWNSEERVRERFHSNTNSIVHVPLPCSLGPAPKTTPVTGYYNEIVYVFEQQFPNRTRKSTISTALFDPNIHSLRLLKCPSNHNFCTLSPAPKG